VANTQHHRPDDDHDHGIAHVAPIKVLLGTWGALMVLTVITVVKATLVILFFMHLAYDKLFHSVMVGGGLLAAGLFIAISLMDSDQYQQNLIWNPEAPPAAPYGPRPLPQ
jgi:cytochrome c oxidase subunit 4